MKPLDFWASVVVMMLCILALLAACWRADDLMWRLTAAMFCINALREELRDGRI